MAPTTFGPTVDGAHWELVTGSARLPRRLGHSAAVFKGKLWIIGGYDTGQYRNDIWCSADGRTWNPVTPAPPFMDVVNRPALVYDDKLWLIGDEIWWTDDGIDWHEATSNTGFETGLSQSLSAVVAFDRMWVVTGSPRGVWWSVDGATWTLASNDPSTPSGAYKCLIAHGNRMWLVGGTSIDEGGSGTLFWSEDGVTWTHEDDPEGATSVRSFGCAGYGDRVWLFFGLRGRSSSQASEAVYSTSDFKSWERHDVPPDPIFSGRQGLRSVIFQNKIWVTGGGDVGYWPGPYGSQDVWSSRDGLEWSEEVDRAPYSRRAYHTMTEFQDKLWIIGGFTGYGITDLTYERDVWYSDNGTSWSEAVADAPFGTRSRHATVSLNDKLWVLGGLSNRYVADPQTAIPQLTCDVWSSTDGHVWSSMTPAADFDPRAGHGALVHRGRMWVIGGEVDGGLMNDLWWSTDGASWHLATHRAAFTPRSDHAVLVAADRMWVIAGEDDEGILDDAWWSVDGIHWNLAETRRTFFPRTRHQSLWFHDQIWTLGGYGDRYQGYLNDAASTPLTIFNRAIDWGIYD